jgi:hypothetical protein
MNSSLQDIETSSYNFINNIAYSPSILVILVVAIVLLVGVFSTSLGGRGNTSSSSFSSSSIPTYGYVLIFLASVFIVSHITGWNVSASIHKLFTSTPEIDVRVYEPKDTPPVPEIRLYPEVFNIPGNNYGYADAKALCAAYGSRLATYKEIENSYNKGGEWCNYGWSDGQMALDPTQQKTYDALQKIEGHEHDCGRPGVNGGYMANPALKFGVNCYGHKPKMTDVEQELMANQPYYPKTKKDLAMEQRVEYWKTRVKDILVSPFNKNSWSRI